MKTIEIKCKGLFALPYDQIGSIQGNLKELTKENYERLRNEIRDTGFAFPVNVTKHPKLGWVTQDGWHRVLVVKTMVEKEGYECPPLPCTEIEWESEEMAGRRILQGSSQFAHTTGEGLYEFMENYKFDFDLAETKFDIPHVDFEEFKEEFGEEPEFQSGEDEVPEVKVETDIKLGDMFQLGEHRLLCGDSTDKAQVDRLMGGEKADMVFTDPPYGINYKSNWSKKLEEIKNDSEFLNFKPIIDTTCEKNSPQYIWTSHQVFHIWRELFSENYKSTIIWYKKFGGMGDLKAEYGHNYEMCLYLCNGRSEFIGDRPKAVWEIGSDNPENYSHPTQKPVALAEYAISHHKKNKILDLFGGSGSTLIACEKTKRKCFMMEIDPIYIDVIIKRWEKFTGGKAKIFLPDGRQDSWENIEKTRRQQKTKNI